MTKKKSTEIRKKQIKKAVLEIISNEGIHSLSTRNLAKKVGFSEAAVFRHFKTKRDILLSIMNDVKSDLMLKLKDITSSDLSAKEKLFQFLCNHVRYLIKNKGITILLFSEAAHLNDSQLKQDLREILELQKKLVSRIIREGIKNGEWNSTTKPEVFSTIYMGVPITLNIELILNPDKLKLNNFCKKMFYLLLKTLK